MSHLVTCNPTSSVRGRGHKPKLFKTREPSSRERRDLETEGVDILSPLTQLTIPGECKISTKISSIFYS